MDHVTSEAGDSMATRRSRNEWLIYATNFLHVVVMSICLGPVFDQYLYILSAGQTTLIGPAPVRVSEKHRVVEGLVSKESFEMSFMIRPNASQPVGYLPRHCGVWWLSIVHLTVGQDCCEEGERIPAIFFVPETRRLVLAMDRPGQPTNRTKYDLSYACEAEEEIPADEWSAIRVKLSGAMGSKGDFRNDGSVGLFVNDKLLCENGAYRGRVPARDGVTMFLGDLWHKAAVADVKELRYGGIASNRVVGLVECVRGLTGFVLLLPLGYFADRIHRVWLIRGCCLLGAVSAMILLTSIFGPADDKLVLRLTLLGVIVFAAYQQCLSGSMVALLGDIVGRGKRYRAMTHYKTTSALAMASAPTLQLLLLLGPTANVWTRETTAILISVGWLLFPGIILCSWLLKPAIPDSCAVLYSGDSPVFGSPRLMETPDPDHEYWLEQQVLHCAPRRVVIPALSEAFQVLTLLSNGMTVRFLPLYFAQERHFSPVNLCLLLGGCRLVVAFSVQLIRPLGNHMGRANLVLFLHLLSTACLWAMARAESVVLASALFIGRFVALHARDPIISSITLDVVDASRRGFWSQFASLRTGAWAGSSLLGGWLADRYGYGYSFSLTCYALLASVPVFLPVLFLFPRSEGRKEPADLPPPAVCVPAVSLRADTVSSNSQTVPSEA